MEVHEQIPNSTTVYNHYIDIDNVNAYMAHVIYVGKFK